MANLGGNLKAARRKMKLTQQSLSELSGVSRSYIAEIERDIHSNITIIILCDLCRVLNCTPNDLIPMEFYR